jgi:hypothetical protein
MPKKRKARRPNIPLYTGPVPLDSPPPAAAAPAAAGAGRTAMQARAGGVPGQIKADYTHVIGDLKRIAVLGGGLIVVLVVLSFFIR